MNELASRQLTRFLTYVALFVTCCCALLLVTGCNRSSDGPGSASNKLKVAYLGLT